MKQLTDAVEKALQSSNWYAALMVALALPDIAGWVDNPNTKSGPRYAAWVERYLSPRYTRQIGPSHENHKFLSGDDCYALRCAVLHEGRDDTSQQRVRDALDRFQFIVVCGRTIHMNQTNTKLQLQVDIFCRDICEAIEEWLESIPSTDIQRTSRLAELVVIQTTGPIQI